MNARGQYGIPLRGGSLYSSSPWGGAPDATDSGWLYRGPRAFHGHEAPTYGRRGAGPPRRGAPLGRGRLVMNVRGTYGKETLVGITLFHGISDRDTAAAQINTQIKTLARAVVSAAGGDPALITTTHDEAMEKLKDPKFLSKVVDSRDAIEKSRYRTLWDDTVSPLFDAWVAFYQDRKHWYDAVTEIFTSWEDYQSWFDRLADARARVQAAGIGLGIPPLHPLHKSLQETGEKAAEKVAEGVGDVWKIAKYGVIAVLGIGAIVALSSVASNLKKGEDPAKKWLEYAGRGAEAVAL